jgi:hypothetical protein
VTWIDPAKYDWKGASDTQVIMMAKYGVPEAVSELERRRQAAKTP